MQASQRHVYSVLDAVGLGHLSKNTRAEKAGADGKSQAWWRMAPEGDELPTRHADLADHGRLHTAPRRHRIVLPPGSDRRLLGRAAASRSAIGPPASNSIGRVTAKWC